MAENWKAEKLGILKMLRQYINYFKWLPNFKAPQLKMASSEDPDFNFETFAEILRNYEGFELADKLK